MRSHSWMVALLTVALPGPSIAHAQQDPTGDWASETGGNNFYYGAGASDGTYLYVFGGLQQGTATAQNPYVAYQQLRRYDPAGNSWTTLAEMPGPTLYNAGAYSDGRLFSFGGYRYYYTGSYWTATYSNLIHAYDLSSNTWETLSATLSTSRYYAAAATVDTPAGERIYVVGGTPGTGVNDEFDPSSDAVATRAPVSNNGTAVQVYLHAMAAVPSTGKLYVMGGLPGPTANVYEYTPPSSGNANGSWTSRASVQNGSGQNQSGYYRAAFALNNRVYLTGGVASPYNQTFEYNPATDTWAQRDGMNGGRYGHAAAAVGDKGYVYGGVQAYSTCEEYTPPDFGSAPQAPANLVQAGSRPESSIQAKDDPAQFDGWTNQQISFSAVVTDPDAGQQVRFRVQVKPEAAAWGSAGVISLDSGLGAQGAITINWPIPAGGGYDWRWRVEDAFQNSYPAALANTAAGWVEAFGNSESPDFRSDQVTPADPLAKFPADIDIQVPDPAVGDVELQWIESTDNGPVAGISYELQVAREGGFHDIEAQLFSTAGTSTCPVQLGVSPHNKHWRIRARDVGGNFSSWSPPLTFRVTHNDGVDHGAGDGSKYCGFGADVTGAPGIAGLIGLLLLAMAVRKGPQRSIRFER